MKAIGIGEVQDRIGQLPSIPADLLLPAEFLKMIAAEGHDLFLVDFKGPLLLLKMFLGLREVILPDLGCDCSIEAGIEQADVDA